MEINNGLSVYAIASGSTGNSVFVRCGSHAVLIDAGICAKNIRLAVEAIGGKMSEIGGIFVTHEHTDHIKGIDVLSRRDGLEVHCGEASAPMIKCAAERFHIHPPRYTVCVGDMEISSFVTPHDSCGSLGYVVRTDMGSFGYATDIGCVTDTVMENLCECDYVLLESNHDVNMLKNGPYPPELKKRILSRRGHLSNDDCADTVCELAKNGVCRVLLGHLSQENNTPECAYRTTEARLAEEGITSLKFAVASPFHPVKLV